MGLMKDFSDNLWLFIHFRSLLNYDYGDKQCQAALINNLTPVPFTHP